MHLLHRSSNMFGGGGGERALRRAGSSPRAMLLSRSESSKKKRGAAKKGGGKGSKRARLRAGLAAALQELRLAGRHRRGPAAEVVGAPGCRADAAARSVAAAGHGDPAPASGGAVLPLLMLLALACVVALGRAPAVCCCTGAAWLCRASAADGRRRGGVLCGDGVLRVPPQQARAVVSNGAARPRR